LTEFWFAAVSVGEPPPLQLAWAQPAPRIISCADAGTLAPTIAASTIQTVRSLRILGFLCGSRIENRIGHCRPYRASTTLSRG